MGLSKRVKRTFVALGALIVAIPLGAWAVDSLTPSVVRRALPAAATDVQEYYSDDGFHGDFVRCLQARMPRSEMPKFASRLGLTERYSSSKDSKLPLSFSFENASSWWQPPDRLAGAYFKCDPHEDKFYAATYQNGQVYFLASAW